MTCTLTHVPAPPSPPPQVYNEHASPFYEANSEPEAAAAALAELSEDEQAESNKMYSINGFIYCNLPGLNMTTGQRCAIRYNSSSSSNKLLTPTVA